MEEVWKDINLASLNDQNTRPMTNHSTLGGTILQDFLARPFNIDPPRSMVSSSSYSASPTPPPPLVTALSLNSRPDFHFDPLVRKPHHHTTAPNAISCFAPNPSLFENLPCTSSLSCFGNKRFAETADCSNPGDRRNKRMIKNRESAARSRARKQEKIAYTNELEQKVELLAEENARLKRQQQELWEAATRQQKKKGTSSSLCRTYTAPF